MSDPIPPRFLSREAAAASTHKENEMPYAHKQDKRIYTGPFVAGHQPYIFTEDVLAELKKARTKFPEQNIWVTLAALTEEVGELNQAVLQLNYEPHKGVTPEQVYKEAVQVAVMAIRVALDCDYVPPPQTQEPR